MAWEPGSSLYALLTEAAVRSDGNGDGQPASASAAAPTTSVDAIVAHGSSGTMLPPATHVKRCASLPPPLPPSHARPLLAPIPPYPPPPSS